MRELNDFECLFGVISIAIICLSMIFAIDRSATYCENLAFIEAGYNRVLFPNNKIDWSTPSRKNAFSKETF